MRPVTDRVASLACYMSVCLSVCQCVTLVSPAKRLKRSNCRLRSGLGWTQGTMYWHGVQIPLWVGAILKGKRVNHCKVRGHSAAICANTAEPIDVQFGIWARMGQRHHALDRGPDPPWEGAIPVDRGPL